MIRDLIIGVVIGWAFWMPLLIFTKHVEVLMNFTGIVIVVILVLLAIFLYQRVRGG